jgi:hypothetical protein
MEKDINKLNLSTLELKKPIAVDSKGKNYFTTKELIDKKAHFSLATLEPGLQRDLVLKRYELEDEYEILIIGGEKISKTELMKEIKEETALGKDAVRAELSYLSDIHAELASETKLEEGIPEIFDLGPWPPEKYSWVPKKWWPIFFRRYAVFAEDTDTGITESAAHYRKKHVIPCFINKRIIPIILTGANDTRPNFAAACKRKGVVYISGVGHGSPTAYTGYRYSHLWDKCSYDPAEVKGKIIHLLSCKTAQQLGPDLVKKGACAYFGYFENFTITWNYPNVFWKCDSIIDLAFCHGLNAGLAAKVTLYIYNLEIRKMRAIHGPTATWLTWDRDALRSPLHGKQYGLNKCTLRRTPFFEELESDLTEAEIEELEILEEEFLDIGELIKDMTANNE